MTDYSKMSDFEINCSALAFFEPEIEHMTLSVDGKSLYHCGLDGNGFHEVVIPDYCNSWADAGPIIVENKIWMRELFGMWDVKGFPSNHPMSQLGYRHANPLRAAMIVFLMMKESK